MQAAIEAAKQAYLANGGKITRLPGFTSVTPMRQSQHPPALTVAPRKAKGPGGYVGRAYIAEGVGLGVKQLFYGGLYNHLLPEPAEGAIKERFAKADADIAIKAIRALRRKNSPDPALHVDRQYICDELGMTPGGLFNVRNSYADMLPEPVFLQHGRGKPKQWYLKKEVDTAVSRIKKARGSRKNDDA